MSGEGGEGEWGVIKFRWRWVEKGAQEDEEKKKNGKGPHTQPIIPPSPPSCTPIHRNLHPRIPHHHRPSPSPSPSPMDDGWMMDG